LSAFLKNTLKSTKCTGNTLVNFLWEVVKFRYEKN